MRRKVEGEMAEESEKIKEKCPHCGGNPLVVDSQHGRVICPHCGRIVRANLMDRGRFGAPLRLEGR